ncbi:46470_t:CDS:2 [Gigaspora margarita]|uniref:Ribosome assembly protein 3 n=1 Tax=Gigaspora margarita TaxID=4874 RepID=A0ABN7UMT9_GIGMA|nr:46470_t:CDS:2 [Gigaspora margarita]
MSTSTSESEVEKTDSENSENSENEPIDETLNSENDEDEDVESSDDDDGSKMEIIENIESTQEMDGSEDSVDSEQEESNDEKMEEDNVIIPNNKKQDIAQKEPSSQKQKMIKDPEPIPLLSRPNAANQFRDHYMSQITKAFGEDLDRIRKDQNLDSNRLEILIDSLESGIGIFSDVEKELALLSHNNK